MSQCRWVSSRLRIILGLVTGHIPNPQCQTVDKFRTLRAVKTAIVFEAVEDIGASR
jgi:hypothetical protein